MDGYAQDEDMDGTDSLPMDPNMIGQPQTLDQIMNQNNQEMMRRIQTYQPQYRPNGQQEHTRRASIMEFGSTDLADFQFDPNPTPTQMPPQMSTMASSQKSLNPRKVRSREDLALDTRFSQMPANYTDQTVNSYSPAMMPGSAMSMEQANFMSASMDMPMDFEAMPPDMAQMNMQNHSIQQPVYAASPVSQSFAIPYTSSSHDSGGCTSNSQTPTQRSLQSGMPMAQNFMQKKPPPHRNSVAPSPVSATRASAVNSMPSPAQIHQANSRRQSAEGPPAYQNTSTLC